MMTLRLILCFLLLSGCLAELTVAQTAYIPSPWTKIRVFESNLSDVERLFGDARNKEARIVQGEIKPNYRRIYDLPNAVAFVTYSRVKCDSAQPLWNVPEWTVIEVQYSPDEGTEKLKDLLAGMKRYKSKQAGDVETHTEYYSDELGISVVYDNEINEVLHITLYPSEKMKLSYDCDRVRKKVPPLLKNGRKA